jgi:hypothetical protein
MPSDYMQELLSERERLDRDIEAQLMHELKESYRQLSWFIDNKLVDNVREIRQAVQFCERFNKIDTSLQLSFIVAHYDIAQDAAQTINEAIS